MVNKRLLATLATNVISALLIALNKKLGLGLDVATVTALAGSIGGTTIGYLWSQAKTDVAEASDE